MRGILGVSRLGDADLRGWWSTHGLDDIGEYVLPDLFPRTWRVAAVQLSVESAVKRHRDFLPDRSNLVHLFSEGLGLLGASREWTAELKTGGDESLLDELQGWRTVDAAESDLRECFGSSPGGDRTARSLRIGVIRRDDLRDHEQRSAVIRMLVASYIGQESDLVIPYFDIAA